MDPFTFQFNSDLSGDESVQSNPDDFEVVSEAPEDMLELVVLPVPELPDAVLARASLKPLRSSTVEVDAEFSEFGVEALDYVELEEEALETIISSPHGIGSSTFAGLAMVTSVSACSVTTPSLMMSFFIKYFGASLISTGNLSKVDGNEDNFKHSSNYETCAVTHNQYKPELWPPDFWT